jgi:hypothetical protein
LRQTTPDAEGPTMPNPMTAVPDWPRYTLAALGPLVLGPAVFWARAPGPATRTAQPAANPYRVGQPVMWSLATWMGWAMWLAAPIVVGMGLITLLVVRIACE